MHVCAQAHIHMHVWTHKNMIPNTHTHTHTHTHKHTHKHLHFPLMQPLLWSLPVLPWINKSNRAVFASESMFVCVFKGPSLLCMCGCVFIYLLFGVCPVLWWHAGTFHNGGSFFASSSDLHNNDTWQVFNRIFIESSQIGCYYFSVECECLTFSTILAINLSYLTQLTKWYCHCWPHLYFSFCVMFILQESLEQHANSLGIYQVVLEDRWDWFEGRNLKLEGPMAVANRNRMANRALQGALGRAPPAWRCLHPFVSVWFVFFQVFSIPSSPRVLKFP